MKNNQKAANGKLQFKNQEDLLNQIVKYSRPYILTQSQSKLKEDLELAVDFVDGKVGPAQDIFNILKILKHGTLGQALKYRSNLPTYFGNKLDDATQMQNSLTWVLIDLAVYESSIKGQEYINAVFPKEKLESAPEFFEGIKIICASNKRSNKKENEIVK